MRSNKNITATRFVAFIDILGFKNLVDNSTHEEVLNQLESLKKSLDEIDKRESEDLKTWIFSDSIMIVSNNDSYSAADAILISVSQIMEQALEIGLLLKGVISFGNFTADFKNSIFFGRPLIDSYLLQEEIKISSIVLHHTFEKRVLQFREDPNLLSDGRTLEFITPLQHGAVSHLHLNWMEYYSIYAIESNELKLQEVDKYTKKLKNLYLNVSGHSRIYIDNTLKFFDACKKAYIV
jgi:hypothetical protein